MDNIMNKPNITITENGLKYTYDRILDSNNIPNYYPPNEKDEELLKTQRFDEIIFLPIESKIFDTDRTHYFFGFRYIVRTIEQRTVSIGPDPSRFGITEFQMVFEVQRIRYEITGERDIIINKSYDPLYPARFINIQDKTIDAAKTIAKVINDIVSEYNCHYMDRHV